jgi:hypothetical protein
LICAFANVPIDLANRFRQNSVHDLTNVWTVAKRAVLLDISHGVQSSRFAVILEKLVLLNYVPDQTWQENRTSALGSLSRKIMAGPNVAYRSSPRRVMTP